MVHCIYLGVTGHFFSTKIELLSLRIILVLANSVDPDEMLCYAAFLLGFQSLPKYPFRGFVYTRG